MWEYSLQIMTPGERRQLCRSSTTQSFQMELRRCFLLQANPKIWNAMIWHSLCQVWACLDVGFWNGPTLTMLMMLILSCQVEFVGLFQSSFHSASGWAWVGGYQWWSLSGWKSQHGQCGQEEYKENHPGHTFQIRDVWRGEWMWATAFI